MSLSRADIILGHETIFRQPHVGINGTLQPQASIGGMFAFRSNILKSWVGDAAWCVTPPGGAGVTLVVVGSYILAGVLHRQQTLPLRSRPWKDGCAHLLRR